MFPGQLEDPGRRRRDREVPAGRGGTVVAQPIYSRYVIADYLRQYRQDPSPDLRAAILKVAHAAIDRMETLKDALMFWYSEELQISRQPEKHYSGLTQAYYAEILFGAYQATGDDSLRAASEQNGETWDMVDLIAWFYPGRRVSPGDGTGGSCPSGPPPCA